MDASTAEKRPAEILFNLGFNKHMQARKVVEFLEIFFVNHKLYAWSIFNKVRRNNENFVRVTNLSEGTRRPDLLKLFWPFGVVSRVYVAINQKTGMSRGFGFVNFVRFTVTNTKLVDSTLNLYF